MALEVYSATKPALPHRAWVAAIGLLALAVGLATGMTWRRTGARLAEPTSPEGWNMSFRVPREFALSDRETSTELSLYSYKLASPREFSAELAAWKVSGPDLSATEVCERILRRNGRTWIDRFSESFPSLRSGPPATRSRELLGGREAIEVADPALSAVVRAVVTDDGAGYAISLRLSGVPLDENTYSLFDITCRSAQFRSP
jgi:hypothetical protein